MSSCEVYPDWCGGHYHELPNDGGLITHSKEWAVLGQAGEISVTKLGDRPAYIVVLIDEDGEYSSDEARQFADEEPAQYERALHEAADLVDEINQAAQPAPEIPGPSTGQGEDG